MYDHRKITQEKLLSEKSYVMAHKKLTTVVNCGWGREEMGGWEIIVECEIFKVYLFIAFKL